MNKEPRNCISRWFIVLASSGTLILAQSLAVASVIKDHNYPLDLDIKQQKITFDDCPEWLLPHNTKPYTIAVDPTADSQQAHIGKCDRTDAIGTPSGLIQKPASESGLTLNKESEAKLISTEVYGLGDDGAATLLNRGSGEGLPNKGLSNNNLSKKDLLPKGSLPKRSTSKSSISKSSLLTNSARERALPKVNLNRTPNASAQQQSDLLGDNGSGRTYRELEYMSQQFDKEFSSFEYLGNSGDGNIEVLPEAIVLALEANDIADQTSKKPNIINENSGQGIFGATKIESIVVVLGPPFAYLLWTLLRNFRRRHA